jgi:hypothetical protein
MTKTFKIGEYAVGGILEVHIKGAIVQAIAKDWNTKREITWGIVDIEEPQAEYKLVDFLNEVTSSYYADKVMTYIKSKINFKH